MTGDSADRGGPQLRALQAAVRALRLGSKLSDREFDRIYPTWVRRLSEMHWSSVAVARRAAALLAVDATTRILDIGSGAGKFCLIGAITTRATFVGIEQRRNLVDVARQLAERGRLKRAQFLHGNMMDLDFGEFDGFYLYNPYYENLSDCQAPIEGAIALAPEYYGQYINITHDKLAAAAIGTRVVTYNGFGGTMPQGYRQLLREPAGIDFLTAWEKE